MRGDVFTCPHTGLSLRKPARWEWVPASWMTPDRDAVVSPSREGKRMLETTQAPIVCLTRAHGSERHVDPTVQLFRRPIPLDGALEDLAATLPTSLAKVFHECRFREITTDAILAGHRALRYLVDYTLLVEPGSSYRCRCLGHVIVHHRHGMTLTMSGSTTRRYRFEEDLQSILSSVTFGRSSLHRRGVT
jgi:hypothetical protein